jgi:hypothetical protein
MSLRFTDPRKWEEPWFRKMAPEDKLAFFYIWERCDNAGFIAYDDEAVAFHTGIAVNRLPKLWAKIADRLVIKSDWMWVAAFPRLQKNWPLNPKNKCHTQIIRLLRERYEHFQDVPMFTNFIAPAKGLLCPSGIGISNSLGQGLGSSFGRSPGNGKGQGQAEETEDINQELPETSVPGHNGSEDKDFEW